MTIAVVAPHHEEDEALSRHAPRRHILVAGGVPRAVVDGRDAWHVKLARCHDDHGDTPRGSPLA